MKVTKEILKTLKKGERISCIIPKNCKKTMGFPTCAFKEMRGMVLNGTIDNVWDGECVGLQLIVPQNIVDKYNCYEYLFYTSHNCIDFQVKR